MSDVAESTRQNKEPWLAASLSWLVPGAGQLCAGSYVRGATFIVFTVLLNVLLYASLMSVKCSILVSLIITICILIVLPAFVSVDAFKVVKHTNTDEFEAARTGEKDPWLAVFLSLILPGLGHAYIRKWFFFVLYSLVFFVLSMLPVQAVYVVIILLLFRVFVCIHAYTAYPIPREQNKKVIIMFAIFLISVQCLSGILIPWIKATYLGGGLCLGGGQVWNLL